MKTIEIIEGNELIAEFMGDSPQYKRTMKYFETEQFGTKYFDSTGLKYHSSWNWLMPVVEKIEDTDFSSLKVVSDHCLGTVNGMVDINRAHTIIRLTPNWTISNVRSGNSKLKSTYYAVIEFIKWYNLNKKS